MSAPVFVVVGSGSLAQSVCYGLSAVVPFPLRVVIAARSAGGVAEISQICSVRAAAAGHPVEFRPWPASPFGPGGPEELCRAMTPRGMLVCCSKQSPWEGAVAPSAWTRLLDAVGIGLALPFHAEFAVRFGRALAAVPGSFFLNGCFPDVVNPVLGAIGVPVLAGIGNIAVLAAAAQVALGLNGQAELRVIGHHVHLHEPAREAEEARGWHGNAPLPMGRLLSAQRAVNRREANQLTGHLAALLVRDLLAGERVATHLPGPNGLPGGYPVLASAQEVTLRLPPSVTAGRAMEMNDEWSWLDGVAVRAGRVVFAPRVAERLPGPAAGLAGGFDVGDILGAARRLDDLRAALRAQPAQKGMQGCRTT